VIKCKVKVLIFYIDPPNNHFPYPVSISHFISPQAKVQRPPSAQQEQPTERPGKPGVPSRVPGASQASELRDLLQKSGVLLLGQV
jgi:hypothetical protein